METAKMRIAVCLLVFAVFAFQKNPADDSLDIFLSSKGSVKNIKSILIQFNLRKNRKSEVGKEREKRACGFLYATCISFWISTSIQREIFC